MLLVLRESPQQRLKEEIWRPMKAELEFLQKRRVVAAEALKQVLQLEEDLQMDEVGKHRSTPSHSCPSSTVPASCPLQSICCPRAASALPFLVALTRCLGEGCAGCDSVV